MRWLVMLLITPVLALGVSSAEAAQLTAVIDPSNDTSEFGITYTRYVTIDYPRDEQMADLLRGAPWVMKKSAPVGSADAQVIAEQLNRKIAADGSQAQVFDLAVDSRVKFRMYNDYVAWSHHIKISGSVGDYTTSFDGDAAYTVIDVGWRGLTIEEPVLVDGVEINYPLSIIESRHPDVASLIRGTNEERLLSEPIIDADMIRDVPLSHWRPNYYFPGLTTLSEFEGVSYIWHEVELTDGGEFVYADSGQNRGSSAADTGYSVTSVTNYAGSADLMVYGHPYIYRLGLVEVLIFQPESPVLPIPVSPDQLLVGLLLAVTAAVPMGAFLAYRYGLARDMSRRS